LEETDNKPNLMQPIQYKILPEKKIILDYCHGAIFFENLIEHQKEQYSDLNFNPTFNIFVDLRDAKSMIKSQEIKTFIEYLKSHSALSSRRAMAILTTSPNVTLFSLLFKNEAHGLPLNIEVFSTLTGAMQHVGLKPEDKGDLENAIKELKFKISEFSH
jgi:hypothetical protein